MVKPPGNPHTLGRVLWQKTFWLYLLSPWYHSTRNATLRLAFLALSGVSVLGRLGERMLLAGVKVVRSGYIEAAATLLRKLTPGLPKELHCSLRVFLGFSPIEPPARQFKTIPIGTQCAPCLIFSGKF